MSVDKPKKDIPEDIAPPLPIRVRILSPLIQEQTGNKDKIVDNQREVKSVSMTYKKEIKNG